MYLLYIFVNQIVDIQYSTISREYHLWVWEGITSASFSFLSSLLFNIFITMIAQKNNQLFSLHYSKLLNDVLLFSRGSTHFSILVTSIRLVFFYLFLILALDRWLSSCFHYCRRESSACYIMWCYLPQGKICFVQEWIAKPWCRPVSRLIGDISNSCTSLQSPRGHLTFSLLLIFMVWCCLGAGLWQPTLQSSTWIVCCWAQSNNVFVTRCQTPYTAPFIFFCTIFWTKKAKYVLLFHGRWNIFRIEIRNW